MFMECRKGEKMIKAYWKGHEIYDIEFHNDWCEILFKMSSFESPITETGRCRVLMEDIILVEEEA